MDLGSQSGRNLVGRLDLSRNRNAVHRSALDHSHPHADTGPDPYPNSDPVSNTHTGGDDHANTDGDRYPHACRDQNADTHSISHPNSFNHTNAIVRELVYPGGRDCD